VVRVELLLRLVAEGKKQGRDGGAKAMVEERLARRRRRRRRRKVCVWRTRFGVSTCERRRDGEDEATGIILDSLVLWVYG